MLKRRCLLLAGIATVVGACARTSESPEALEVLRQGGHVIYFRHGATDWKGNDSQTWPREQQRLLSDEGIAQSRRIGQRFRALGIPVAEVRASPFFRCTEMGQIAFGRATPDNGLLSTANAIGTAPQRVAYLRTLLSTPHGDDGNLVLIAHSGNIRSAAGVRLAEGEAAVFRPLGADGFELTAQVLPEEW